MQPFFTADKVKDAYRRYIETSFPIRRESLRREFGRLVAEERLLWQEPYVSLARPFQGGASLAELVGEGVLGPAVLAAHWPFPRLFGHQEQAVRRLSTLSSQLTAEELTRGGDHNTVVATGTGSGKTESFLIPIVDHCQRHPGAGVQAVILYPMNALINDQLKRLRRALAGTGVTFARYTGDTPESLVDAQSRGQALRPVEAPEEERYYRTEIWASPPQILLTNHTMLEFLLLRKKDQELFLGRKPRYLVLDEVHTFVGALGAEVACLIRRFKEHCGLAPGELICCGTSATIQDPQDPAAARARVLAFASELFAEPFEAAALVEEAYTEPSESPAPAAVSASSLRPLSPADVEAVNPDDPEAVRRLAERALDVRLTVADDLYGALYTALAGLPQLVDLEAYLTRPRPISALVQRLRGLPGWQGMDESQVRATVSGLFLLGCAARRPHAGNQSGPRLKPKVHLFVRSLTPLHLCLGLQSEHLLTDGETVCGHPDHEDGQVQAPMLVACRSCGADYRQVYVEVERWRAATGRGQGRRRPSQVGRFTELPLSTEKPALGAFQALYLGRWSGEAAPDDEGQDGAPDVDAEIEEESAVRPALVMAVCPHCLVATQAPIDGGLFGAACPRCNRVNLPQHAVYEKANRCPRCGALGRGRRPEILTPLRSGAAPSIAVLAQSLLPALEPGEKKFLIFADSRQDTAHQAGYLRDRHQVFTQRQLVYRILLQHEQQTGAAIALPELAREVFLQTRALFDSEVDAVNLLKPIRRPEDVGFVEPEEVITNSERTHLINQLRWELALEFTYRAADRYSLEREGLTAVRYARLAETTAEALASFERFGIHDPAWLETLLRATLDSLRVRKAVGYEPFQDYLDAASDAVRRGIANPTTYMRTPVGFSWQAQRRSGAYEVKGWTSSNRRSVMEDWLRRAMPELGREQSIALIEALVRLLEHKRYLVSSEIGKRSARYGRLVTHAHQVAERVIEVSAQGERVRCPTCGVSRGYLLRAGGAGDPVCLSYGCQGRPQPFTPDPAENFYVEVYSRPNAERLFPMEHSGQIPSAERERLEARFNEGRINALVCTPTLELGVNITDLPALILRNVPPTPSNYAQRAGRAGRERRIALILSHAGQGPHDSYFFRRPEEMIVGAIRPPIFLLDNRAVIDRHLNSLILEKLTASVPSDWLQIRTEDGHLRSEVLQPFGEELAQRRDLVRRAVASAFVREKQVGGLAWLDDSYVQQRMDCFVPEMSEALEVWCGRWRALFGELVQMRTRVIRPTPADQERERRLVEALTTLEQDVQYKPLSFLGLAGFLPRYGFPGAAVAVRDEKEREITQNAVTGLTEYAPGNRVYVGGRKLRVDRILFRSGLRADPRQNADTYRYCPQCSYASAWSLAMTCPHCGETLTSGRFVTYEAARGRVEEAITQDDEVRHYEDYDVATYLAPRAGDPTPDDVTRSFAGWEFAYSRLRQVELYNRGLRSRETGEIALFTVCLECGMVRDPRRSQDSEPSRNPGWGHLPTCTVRTWDPDQDDRIVRDLHLRAGVQGDVIELPLSPVVAGNAQWVQTFTHAWLMGLSLEFYVRPGEIKAFRRDWEEGGQTRSALVFYDTMPGGTGYLKRMVEDAPRLAGRIADHLRECECERACYRCLKDYWNQRVHGLMDKRLVVRSFESLAAATPGRFHRPLDENTRFDSFLEAEFHRLLEQAGLPLPATQQVVRSPAAGYIMRADFTWPRERLVVLTDGRAFHAQDPVKIVEDLDRRNTLVLEGYRLLEFTYQDVIDRPEGVVEMVRQALAESPAQIAETLEDYAAIPVEAQPFVDSLCRQSVRFRRGGRIALAPGRTLETLAVDSTGQIALVLVDTDRWAGEGPAWQRDLASHNQARVRGWRLVRLPNLWLHTGQAQTLLDRLTRS